MSGLALACQIDRSNSCASGRINKAFVVVEPRNKYQRDKTGAIGAVVSVYLM